MSENNTSRSNRQKDKRKQQNNRVTSIVKKVLLVLVFILLLVVVSGAGLFVYYASSAPELTDDDLYGTYSSELVDRNGDVFYTIGSDSREFASADEYPQVLEDAVLAIEDQRFYNHSGVDPIGIARAGLGYITEGQVVGGGSTITQQLIKLSVFSTSREDQTLERKAQEAWLAIQLERQLSKEQILTLYLNRVHMAENIYGMGTAAQEYYGKHVSDLELHEAALLAGMPQAPNRYNPYRNPEAAGNRRNTVLRAMYEADYISGEEYSQASALPATEGLVERTEQLDGEELYLDGYITAVLDEVAENTDYNPYTAGLKIHTNIDLDIQEFMFNLAHDENYIAADDELQTAMTLMDPNSGELLGVIGGRNIDGHLSLNRATENTRNVASTIKPLTVYGPAIEFNQRSTYEQIVDEPYTVEGTDWEPTNWDGEFLGQMSTREALVNSRNIPAAKILNEELQPEQVNGFLEGLGIDPANLTGSEGVVPSSAIDGSMTPMQLAGAYAAFANGGTYIEPYTVSEIVTQDGQSIDTRPESTQAMEDYTAYMVTDMLKGVIDLYGPELEVPGIVHAGKTGTSNYSTEQHEEHNIPTNQGLVPDSWFVGYSPEYTMSVWVGYDNHLEEGNQLSNANGKRQLPRHLYREVMSVLAEDAEGSDWEQPTSVSEIEVVDGSNPAQLASPSTPASQRITELFVTGNEPSTNVPQEPLEDQETDEDEDDSEETEETDDDESEEETEETDEEVTNEAETDSEDTESGDTESEDTGSDDNDNQAPEQNDNRGNQGNNGNRGNSGNQGNQGNRDNQGNNGNRGNNGNQGDRGGSGNNGNNGGQRPPREDQGGDGGDSGENEGRPPENDEEPDEPEEDQTDGS